MEGTQMEHWNLRCKHCKTIYRYCTYGNGPEYGTEYGCSQEYCAECQKAIDSALGKIPVKFCPKRVEINDDDTLKTLEKIKDKVSKNNNFNLVSVFPGEYDNIDRYTHDWKVYYVAYNNDNPSGKHLFVEMEYDIINKQITKNTWTTDNGSDTYTHGIGIGGIFKNFKNATRIKPHDIPAPDGKFFYTDYAWDVESPTKIE
jgi:hypothetical protein